MEKILSIAIPTLNRAKYLEFTLESFITQVQEHSNEVEIVICSNACDDNTSEIVHKFTQQYNFIRYK